MRGKSVCVVGDLTIEEQSHLYKIARMVKEQLLEGKFPSIDARNCAYLMFFEDSTRTKESFRNAAETLSFRTNIFDASSSSLNKFETLNDTVRMLCGYTAMQSVFVVRSKIEGVCRSLCDSMTEYARRARITTPSFVNAGDGKHEHPTQEFLDEFSFLEQLGGSSDKIHIALVGDLLFGRTIHSKADGLRIFKTVGVDLVAPRELQLPLDYVNRMKANGFTMNFYASLDEYLSVPQRVAPILYFTRLQLERMDKGTLSKEPELRKATSLRMDMISKLPKGAKIYHPLPRHGEFPEVPFEVDRTEFNGYDEQSRNGFFLRTALLGLLTGVYEDVPVTVDGQKSLGIAQGAIIPHVSSIEEGDSMNEFFEKIAKSTPSKFAAWIEVTLPEGTCPSKVRKAFSRMRVLSNIEEEDGFCQVTRNKGFHSIPDSLIQSQKWIIFIATYFAGCSPRIVYEEAKGLFCKMDFPQTYPVERVSGVDGLGCPNPACVSHPDSKQRDVPPFFEKSQISINKFSCRYCEREVSGLEMFA